MLKISCILTSYNRPRFVCNAIDSVLRQTYPHWELVIVDDQSTAETLAVLREHEAKDARIRVLQSGVREEDRMKTARYASCINLAIPLLTGELVTYLTDDDVYLPERFERMAEVFMARPDIHVLYGMQRLSQWRDGRLIELGIRPMPGITRTPATLIDHNSVMHRASCFQLAPRWNDDPAFWGWADAIFFMKLAEHWDFHPLEVLTDEHRFHDRSIQSRFNRGESMYSDQTE